MQAKLKYKAPKNINPNDITEIQITCNVSLHVFNKQYNRSTTELRTLFCQLVQTVFIADCWTCFYSSSVKILRDMQRNAAK